MAPTDSNGFLAGVIEGFYGPPWSSEERRQLFDWMSDWGLNTYFYCLKDDLKNRAIWRESYTAAERAALGGLVRECQQRGIRFVYGLSPGLDIRYSSEADEAALRRRFQEVMDLGCRDFALLFDDIPDRMDEADMARWGSLAQAQCAVTNALFAWTRERVPDGRFLFCPTPYCGRMFAAGHGGEEYLLKLGRHLRLGIDIFWTGGEIISREIEADHIRVLQRVLRRKPVIWDNLHANDYDGRRFFCGPYSGRPTALKEAVNGILTNPNCEFPLNYVPLRTFAEYLRCGETWHPREAYRSAMAAWLGEFGTVGKPFTLEDLVMLGDCYYLPHEEGPDAESLVAELKGLLAAPIDPGGTGGTSKEDSTLLRAEAVHGRITHLRDVCARMAELRNRPLFYALSRRIWELREELDLLDRYLTHRRRATSGGTPFRSDFHLPGTYRGGLVAKLQRLLTAEPDGSFQPAAPSR